MPPRYAYWTVLIDNKPTAFRAREREELLPTFRQLERKNPDIVMKWFARGRLWESPEAAQAAQRTPKVPIEKRGHTWRPGGEHRDPRERFKKRAQLLGDRPEPSRNHQQPSAPGKSHRWAGKPKAGLARGDRPWGGNPPGELPRGAAPPFKRGPKSPSERIQTNNKPPQKG